GVAPSPPPSEFGPATLAQSVRATIKPVPAIWGMPPRPGRGVNSRPDCEKIQQSLFEHLVADRKHVIAARNLELLCARNECSELLRRAGDEVLAADRDQHRHADRRHLFARQGLARAADACR